MLQKNKTVYGYDATIGRFFAIFKQNRLHHAYLISGSRGVGKATLSYYFARFLLQPIATISALTNMQIDYDTPQVLQFDSMHHPDFMLLDAGYSQSLEEKKEYGINIDEVRELCAFLRLTPALGGYRVAIIDGAEFMNYNAANALLKMLEEPKKNSILFLVTHAKYMLPITIRSRCSNIYCGGLNKSNFQKALKERNQNMQLSGQYKNMSCTDYIDKLFDLASGDITVAQAIHQYNACSIVDMIGNSLNITTKSRSNSNCNDDLDAIIAFALQNKTCWEIVKLAIIAGLQVQIKKAVYNSTLLEEHLNIMDNAVKLVNDCDIYHLDKSNVLTFILKKNNVTN